MQPESVKDKWHEVTTHTGSWPISESRNHNSPEPDKSCGFAATVPKAAATSLMLLLARYIMLAMAETKAV